MAARKTPKKQSKFAFIRQQPATLSAAEVVAKAKALGMKFDVTYVHKARRTAKEKEAAAVKKTVTAKPTATATSKSTAPSKSDFIRAQPAKLSAAEVVAKGKAEGVKFSSQLVYRVRGGSKAKKVIAKKPSTVPTAAPSKSPAAVSKADFVRARSHLSAEEIVEDAKAAGIKLGASYIHDVRGYDTAKAKKKRAAKKASKLAVTHGTQPSITATSSTAEDLLRAVAAEVGLGRAIELLWGERARVRAVIEGG